MNEGRAGRERWMGYPPGGVPPSATLEGGARWRQVFCDEGANDAGYSGRDGVKRSGTEPSGRVSPSIGTITAIKG